MRDWSRRWRISFKAVDAAIARGFNLIVLSDRGMDKDNVPIPALLAVAGMHHHLIRQGKRTQVGLILESGEPREIHHFAALIGYGATAINPYLAYEAVEDLVMQGALNGSEPKKAVKNYLKASTKGIVKTLSKMGISSIQSYCGAQIFEAIGIHQSVIDRYFTWTPSRIGGIDIDIIAQEAEMRHKQGYPKRQLMTNVLPTGGEYQWRQDGEYHLFNPLTIHKLQKAVRNNSYADFKEYSALLNAEIAKRERYAVCSSSKQPSRFPSKKWNPSKTSCSASKRER